MEYDLGPISLIPLGEGRNFRAGDTLVAVFRTRTGEVFATQPNCPHKQGPLADGLLGQTILVCPLHDRSWDLRSGNSTTDECPLVTYPVRITEEGRLELQL